MTALTELQSIAAFLAQTGHCNAAQVITEIHAELQAEHRALVEERDMLRSALEQTVTASDFFSQPGIDEMQLRYAHESTARLARAALSPNDKGEG